MRRWFRKKDHIPEDLDNEAVISLEEEAQEAFPPAMEDASAAQEIRESGPDTPPPAESISPEAVSLLEDESEAAAPEAEAEAPSSRPGFFHRMFRKEALPEETEAPEEEMQTGMEVQPAPAAETPPVRETSPALETQSVIESPPTMEVPPVIESPPVVESQPLTAPIPPEPILEEDEDIIDLLDELPEDAPGAAEVKKRRFRRFRERLVRTRQSLAGGLERLFLGRREVDADVLDELEEMLITADLGVDTTLRLVEVIREKVKRRELSDADRLKEALREEMVNILSGPPPPPRTATPWVILMVGVNGVGKTTTIAKLAYRERRLGRNPMLIAADTFRASAVEQLEIWGERVGAQVVKQKTGADPAAVVFDGLEAALARGVDTVFVDTAGRLHTKVNLMEELKKIHRTATKKMAGAPHEILLILDATTGQNALSQARLFHEAVGVTGIVLTKLDGTAKGGMALAVSHETGLPIRYVGVGEGMTDLQPFDPEAFVAAILD